MIALDTNLLVRIVTRDDPRQAQRAAALMRTNFLWIAKTVLLEMEWVLRYTYEFSPAQVDRALRSTVSLQNATVEDPEAVLRAIEWRSAGIDFADALHLASAHGARRFVTFDKALVKRAARLRTRPAAEIVSLK